MTTETSSTPQIKFSWLIGTLAALTIFAVIGAYSSSVANHTTDYDDQRAIDRIETLAKLQKEANDTLTSSDWVDQTKQIVRIPIQEAMTKELDLLRDNTVHQCEAIPGTAPAPAAPASTNAAPVSAKTPPAPAAPNK